MVTYLGSLVQSRCGEGETLQTNTTDVCGECSQRLGHTGCSHSWHMCFPSLHFSGSRLLCRELSEVSPGLYALPRSKPLRFRFSTKAQTRLGLRFVPFPGPSSSGNQVLGEFILPRWGGASYHPPVPALQFPGCAVGAPSQVCCCVSPLGR